MLKISTNFFLCVKVGGRLSKGALVWKLAYKDGYFFKGEHLFKEILYLQE